MSDVIEGYLEIGHNDAGEVVINLPRDMTGHIKFSPDQARGLAATLIERAHTVEEEQDAHRERERVANLPPVDRSAQTLTNGSPVTADHREINPITGQQKGYVVLSDEERAKGFVRPVRRSYVHVGRMTEIENDAGAIVAAQRLGGCGVETTMSNAIAETYARDPKFYGGTFCCQCRKHLPVNEFVWSGTDQEVGS